MALNDNKFLSLFANPQDIISIARVGKSAETLYGTSVEKFVKGAKGGKSIIGMAAKNTFEFPVFISDTVPLDYGEATCTLLEQMYASYVQMAISMNPIVDVRDIKKGGYLSNFIANTTKYVEYADESFEKDSCHNTIFNEDGIFEFEMMAIDDDSAEFINEFCSHEPLDEFDHFFVEADDQQHMPNLSLEDFYKVYNTSRSPKGQVEAEKEFMNYQKLREEVINMRREGNVDPDAAAKLKAELTKLQAEVDPNPPANPAQMNGAQYDVHLKRQQNAGMIQKIGKEIKKLDAEIEKLNKEKDKLDKDTSDVKDKLGNTLSYDSEIVNKRRKLAYDAAKAEKDINTYDRRFQYEVNKNAREAMAKSAEFIDENKINKLNTLKPLMMRLQIRVSNPSGNVTEYPIELICGVKTHCRMVKSETLPEVAKYPLKEMNELTRSVKYKAGELKFFKDLVFNIKEKKQTAIDSKDPSKRWYRRLYELAHKQGDSFVASSITGNRRVGLMPNASLIISQADVDAIMSETEIDLLKGSTAKKFCNELFMMALVVIDQDRQSVKMMCPDLHNDFSVHSIAAINKKIAELDTAGTKTRDIFKLLG